METEKDKMVVENDDHNIDTQNIKNNESDVKLTKSINKMNYLRDWMDRENFDEISSIVTDSINNDNLTDNCSSSVIDSEDLSEYMRNLKTDDSGNTSNAIISKTINTLQDENLLNNATSSINNYLSTQNSLNYNHGNISVANTKGVHIGNVIYITGPIQIMQTSTNNENSDTNQTKQSTINQNVSETDESEENSSNKNYFLGNMLQITNEDKLMIVDRNTWLAQKPLEKYEYINDPVPYVIIIHTATELPLTQAESIYFIRNIQTFHIESKKYNDIAYNFLIGGEGNVYKGRGWGVVGSHTFRFNHNSIGIAFIGCFIKELPPKVSLNACKLLIKRGVELGYIKEDYKLLGHCQLRPFESPEKRLFEEIKTWPHFSNTL